MSDQFNYGSSVTIEEKGPSGPGLKARLLILVGPSLPFMGAEWGFENNVITTWYPGNAIEATQQNLGPRELPSTWEGEWKRTMMGREPTIYVDEFGDQQRLISPHVLREVFEDIARSGVRLRVTWTAQGQTATGSGFGQQTTNVRAQIVREGLVKSFKTPIDRHTDIRWTCEFNWASRGGVQNRVASTRQDTDLSSAADELEQSVNATLFFTNTHLVTIDRNLQKVASNFTLGQLEALANGPKTLVDGFLRKLQQNVDQFKRVGQVVVNAVNQPTAIANSVRDFARNTTDVANQFADDMGRRPPELMTDKTRPTDVLRSATYFAGVTKAAQQNARQGQLLDDQVRRTIVAGANRGEVSARDGSTSRAGDIIAVHVTKSGETPQNLSMRFYGDAEHGADILIANRMPGYQPFFDPGTILVIPSLTVARNATTG